MQQVVPGSNRSAVALRANTSKIHKALRDAVIEKRAVSMLSLSSGLVIPTLTFDSFTHSTPIWTRT